jgi:hypothetical protein
VSESLRAELCEGPSKPGDGSSRARILLTLAALGALALTLSGCESTESESARLGREGAKLIAGAGTVGLGGANSAVHVGQVALVQGSGRTAAVVQLTNTGADAQANVPVLIDVRSAKGASLYRNDIQGLEPSLQQMPLLRPHLSEWWVDDQVLASAKPSSVKVRIGDAKSAPAKASGAGSSTVGSSAGVQVNTTGLGSDVAGPYLAGEAVNHTGVAQHNMPIFAVALRGGRVVAGGRALVPNLPVSPVRPTAFRIYLVGAPAGAHIELTAAPAVGA